jgi:hypothetical protein
MVGRGHWCTYMVPTQTERFEGPFVLEYVRWYLLQQHVRKVQFCDIFIFVSALAFDTIPKLPHSEFSHCSLHFPQVKNA